MNILFDLIRLFDGDLFDKAMVQKLSSTRESRTCKLLEMSSYFS